EDETLIVNEQRNGIIQTHLPVFRIEEFVVERFANRILLTEFAPKRYPGIAGVAAVDREMRAGNDVIVVRVRSVDDDGRIDARTSDQLVSGEHTVSVDVGKRQDVVSPGR